MIPRFYFRLGLATATWFSLCCVVTGCRRPPATPTSGQNQPRQESVAVAPVDEQHRPSPDDLTRFLLGKLPPSVKLVELKSDPPVPLPGTAAGDNAWSYNVRVTFAPLEDVLRPPAPKDTAAFRSAVDELSALAAWSQAYASSPYAGRYPDFSVDPPVPARPKLLVVAHSKDQPLAPLYGQISAQWQVDHWNYEVASMQSLPDEPGILRSQYKGPILIQGSPEAERYMAQVKAGLDSARPKKAALDAAYQADLHKATQPGTTYKGTLTHGKNAIPSEAHFLAAAVGDEPGAVRMEFRLPETGYTYLCSVRLATSPPVPPVATPSSEAEEQDELTVGRRKPTPKTDLALGYLHVTDPKSDRAGTPSYSFRSATMTAGTEDKTWLTVHNGRLAGKMTLYDFDPPYLFDGQIVP